MKIYRLCVLMLSVWATLLGCSKESGNESDKNPNNNSNVLVFGVDGVETRGSTTTSSSITEFGVFCFDTNDQLWHDATAAVDKLYNQSVKHTGNKWAYSPPVYWGEAENKYHTFFAYSPLAKGLTSDLAGDYDEPNVNGNNLKLVSAKGTKGVPKLEFEAFGEIMDQVDVLVAKPRYDQEPVESVLINFSHALTRVSFLAFSEVSGTYLDKIEINGIKYKGTMNMVSPVEWSAVDPSIRNFTIDYGSGKAIMATQDKPIDVTAPSRYLMTVPQDWTGNTKSNIKVYYRQKGVTIERDFIIGASTKKWSANSSVTYILDLNVNEESDNDMILSDVIIDQWRVGSTNDSDLGLQSKFYDLKFDLNGGSGDKPDDQNLETGSLYKIPAIIPVNEGFIFEGWNMADDGSGNNYKIGSRVPIYDQNVILYANWLRGFTIDFDANGGEVATVPSSIFVREGTDLTIPMQKPKWGLHEFLGWTELVDGTGTIHVVGDKVSGIDKSMTYYAKWKKRVTVRYDLQGGTDGPSAEVVYANEGYIIPLTPSPTKAGYIFDGYNTLADGTGTQYKAGDTATVLESDLMLYAQWKPIFTIRYNMNGGEGETPASGSVIIGGSYDIPTTPTPTREGYLFDHWNTQADGKGTPYKPGDNISTVNANITLYAQWKQLVTISFSFNGGEGSIPDEVTLTVGQSYDIPEYPVPSRDGYQFVGWNINSSGTGTTYHPGETISNIRSSIKLFAKWQAL